METNKRKTIILCLLVVVFLLLVAVSPSHASAATELTGTLSATGDYTHQGEPSGTIPTGSAGTFSHRFYRGVYPDTSNPTQGSGTYCSGLNASRQGQPYANYFSNDLDAAFLSQATTTGEYWLGVCQNPSADVPTYSVIDYYFPFTIDGYGNYAPSSQSQPSQQTRILSYNTPANLSVTASTTVDFSMDYYVGYPFDAQPDEICIVVNQIGTAFPTVQHFCDDVSASGESTFATTTVLSSGSQYYYQGYFKIDGEIVYGSASYSRFSVVTEPLGSWASVILSATTSTTSAYENTQCNFDSFIAQALCNVTVFLFVPPEWANFVGQQALSEMSTRVPFVYVASFAGMVEAVPYTTDETPPTIALALFGDEEIPIITDESYNALMGTTTHDVFYALMRAAIYLGLGVALWNLRKIIFK